MKNMMPRGFLLLFLSQARTGEEKEVNEDRTICVEGYINSADFAAMVGVSPRTLGNWAKNGIGPRRYMFSSRCARYATKEVQEWLESHQAA